MIELSPVTTKAQRVEETVMMMKKMALNELNRFPFGDRWG